VPELRVILRSALVSVVVILVIGPVIGSQVEHPRPDAFAPAGYTTSRGGFAPSRSNASASPRASNVASSDGTLPACVPCQGTHSCLPQCADVLIYVAIYLQNTSSGATDAGQITINGVAVTTPPSGTLENFNYVDSTPIGVTNFQEYGCPGSCFYFGFSHWWTDAGYFGTSSNKPDNSSNQSTTFTAYQGDSDRLIIAVLTPVAESANWAGYEVSGSHVTAVSGDVGGPASSSYVSGITNGCSSNEEVAGWVGIGGQNGLTDGLWQGGVIQHYSSSGSSLKVELFVEYVSSSYPWSPYINYNVTINSADPTQVSVWVSGTQLYFQFSNSVTGTVIWGGSGGTTWSALTGLQSGVYPDMSTAEWITEAPLCTGNSPEEVSPAYTGAIKFTNPDWTDSSTGHSSFLAPLAFNDYIGQFDVMTAVCTSGLLDQYLSPGSIDSTFLDFSVTYSQACV
jgi:hypothetical protein